MPTQRQTSVNRTVQWAFPFFAGLALSMAVIACGTDPGNAGPAAQPSASDQEETLAKPPLPAGEGWGEGESRTGSRPVKPSLPGKSEVTQRSQEGDPSEIVRSVTSEDDKHVRRQEANVEYAWLESPDILVVNAGTCRMNPEVSFLEETDVDVQIMMTIDFHPPRLSYPECLTEIIVQLDSPLGDRAVVDKHTGRVVSVTPAAGASPANGQQDQPESPQPEEVPPDIREAVSEAELQDLQAVAEQYGMTLQEAFDRYAWNDNFSRMVQRVRAAAPDTFAGAEIVDATNAWIAFSGTPPKAALDIIDEFRGSYRGVEVEVRTGQRINEAEIGEAVSVAHDAVRKAPEVLDALSSFAPSENRISITVLLADSAPDSVVDDLRATAEQHLVEVMWPDILDSISVSVTRATVPVILIKE